MRAVLSQNSWKGLLIVHNSGVERIDYRGTALIGHGGVFMIGRDFKLRAVPSCGINQLTGSRKHDRQLESQLDKFFDDEERRQNLHHSVPVRKFAHPDIETHRCHMYVNVRWNFDWLYRIFLPLYY